MKFALVPTTFLKAAQALAAHTMISNKQEGMSALWYIPNSKSSPLELHCDRSLTFIVIRDEVAILRPTGDFGVHLFSGDLGVRPRKVKVVKSFLFSVIDQEEYRSEFLDAWSCRSPV